MIVPALRNGGYEFKTRVHVGRRPDGKDYVVNIVASNDAGRTILVALMWQQVSGTAEQKVPFEVISLIHALRSNQRDFAKAYLVLGGTGWTLRRFYTEGGLTPYLKMPESVEILRLEDFIAKANQGGL